MILTLDYELHGYHVHAPVILRPDNILSGVTLVNICHRQLAEVALVQTRVRLQLGL